MKSLRQLLEALAAQCTIWAALSGCSHVAVLSDHTKTCETDLSRSPSTPEGKAYKRACAQKDVPQGLVYSLPKGQVLIAVVRAPVTSADLAKAQDALTAASQVLDADKKKLDEATATQKKNASAGASATQRQADNEAVSSARTAVQIDQSAVEIATETVNSLKGAVGSRFVETVALTPLPTVPDGSRFVANLSHVGYRDDSLKLSVVNGLLTSTTTQSTDQTPNIISSLASAAVGLTTLLGSGIPLVPASPEVAAAHAAAKKPVICEWAYARSFDPANQSEVEQVRTDLQSAAFLSLDIKLQVDSSQPKLDANSLQGTPINGLVYRAALGAAIQVTPLPNALSDPNCPLQSLPAAQSIQMIVPDTNTAFVAPTRVGGFTSSNLQFNFNAGMLTDYNVTRPSEIAAVAGIPVDIVNKIMTIPTSILKLRLDYSSAQTNLLKQQADLISAQGNIAVSLVNAKTALQTAQTNLTQAELNDPTSRLKALTALVQAQAALQAAIAASAVNPTPPAAH